MWCIGGYRLEYELDSMCSMNGLEEKKWLIEGRGCQKWLVE